MSDGDVGGSFTVKEFVEPSVAQGPACHLDRFTCGLHLCGHIEVVYIQVNAESLAESLYMTHVAHGFLTAEMEIAVCRTAVTANIVKNSK